MSYQTFPIVYKGETFFVNPQLVSQQSKKFAELVNNQNMNDSQLTILDNDFTSKTVGDFLKLLQQQQITVDTSADSMRQMAELSELFGADFLKQSALDFIHKTIDQDYQIQMSTNSGLVLESSSNKINNHHHLVFDELEFEEDENSNDSKSSNSVDPKKDNLKKNEKIGKLIYKIRKVEKPFKATKLFIMLNGQVIYSAKANSSSIIVEKGKKDIHIKHNSSAPIKITREGADVSKIKLATQQFFVNYNHIPNTALVSMSTNFEQDGQRIDWSPMLPRQIKGSQIVYLPLKGQYKHSSIPSKHNLVMKNQRGKIVFINRKVEEDLFEVEVSPILNQEIAVALCVSAVMGPFETQLKKMIV